MRSVRQESELRFTLARRMIFAIFSSERAAPVDNGFTNAFPGKTPTNSP